MVFTLREEEEFIGCDDKYTLNKSKSCIGNRIGQISSIDLNPLSNSPSLNSYFQIDDDIFRFLMKLFQELKKVIKLYPKYRRQTNLYRKSTNALFKNKHLGFNYCGDNYYNKIIKLLSRNINTIKSCSASHIELVAKIIEALLSQANCSSDEIYATLDNYQTMDMSKLDSVGQKWCLLNDIGAPLVADQSKLVWETSYKFLKKNIDTALRFNPWGYNFYTDVKEVYSITKLKARVENTKYFDPIILFCDSLQPKKKDGIVDSGSMISLMSKMTAKRYGLTPDCSRSITISDLDGSKTHACPVKIYVDYQGIKWPLDFFVIEGLERIVKSEILIGFDAILRIMKATGRYVFEVDNLFPQNSEQVEKYLEKK